MEAELDPVGAIDIPPAAAAAGIPVVDFHRPPRRAHPQRHQLGISVCAHELRGGRAEVTIDMDRRDGGVGFDAGWLAHDDVSCVVGMTFPS